MLDAGALRHRLEIQQNLGEGTYDSEYGAVAENWDTVATIWASVTTLSGREAEHARQLDAQASHRIEHRYYRDLTVRHRYLLTDGDRTRIFHIGHLDDIDQRRVKHVALVGEIVPASTT